MVFILLYYFLLKKAENDNFKLSEIERERESSDDLEQVDVDVFEGHRLTAIKRTVSKRPHLSVITEEDEEDNL